MNKEVGYIWRGFFLLLVVLTGTGIVQLLVLSKPADSNKANVLATESSTIPSTPVYNEHGKILFQANCAVCHKLGWTDEMLDLPHALDRIPDPQLLRAWIRNSDSVLKTGNPYFNALYEKWNKVSQPPFRHLSDKDIDEILEYIWRHR